MTVTHTMEAELERLAAYGLKPMRRSDIETELRAHGYTIDGPATCFCRARLMTGEFAGSSFPAAQIQVKSLASGKSYSNIDSPRDSNFEWLQSNRDRLFYVVKNHITSI